MLITAITICLWFLLHLHKSYLHLHISQLKPSPGHSLPSRLPSLLQPSPEYSLPSHLPSHLPSLAAPSLATHQSWPGIPTFPLSSNHGNFTCLVVIHGSYSSWDGYILSEWFDILTIIESKGAKVHPGGASSWEDLEAGLIAGFGRLPDAIIMVEQYHLIDEWGPRKSEALRAMKVVTLNDDLHFHAPLARAQKLASFRASDLPLLTYPFTLPIIYPELVSLKTTWIPHSAGRHFDEVEFNTEPIKKVLLAGSTGVEYYPYRYMIVTKYVRGDDRFTVIKHPGYSADFSEADTLEDSKATVKVNPITQADFKAASNENAGTKITGRRFASTLNSYLACITCGSKLLYTVAKIFEIPASGCLLLLNHDMSPQVLALGFEHGVHYLAYTVDTLDEIVDWVLDEKNKVEVNEIR